MNAASLPPAHPQRLVLADEVHARPPEPLETPSRASYVAVLVDPGERASETIHLAQLCERFGVAAPAAGASQFSARLGALAFKWERHGEFSGYTFILPGRSTTPFSEPPTSTLPEGWLGAVPGQTIVAAHGELVAEPAQGVDARFLSAHFGGHIVVGAEIGDGAGAAYTDFRIHADGCSRFLIVDRAFTPRQAGRNMQRLFEIEAYRMMALLAWPIAREQSLRATEIENELASLTAAIAAGADARLDEGLLHSVTRLAADVERALAATQFRFGARKAYHDLVDTRIGELRERRIAGIQTVGEFMARRFTPAMATCATVAQRLHQLSERVAQASGLLSTRVDIARERQNQNLLASMDRRAHLQLRLQQTVEGLSVAAIVYYAAGLVGYVAKAMKSRGLPLDTDLLVALSIPVLAAMVLLALRRARLRLHTGDRPEAAQP